MSSSGFWAGLWEWWRAHSNMPVPLKKAILAAVLVAVAAFYMGRLHPQSDYADLQLTANQLRGDFRQLAQVREDDEIELRRLRLQVRLDEETISRLKLHSRELTRENLEQLEKEVFYKQLGARTKEKLNIYALEETPDFRPGVRLFSAALITPPRRHFVGGYYFEAVTKKGDTINAKLVRAPKEGVVSLSVNIYADIEEAVEMSDDLEINRLRLVVVDKNGNHAAEAVLEAEQDTVPESESSAVQGKEGE